MFCELWCAFPRSSAGARQRTCNNQSEGPLVCAHPSEFLMIIVGPCELETGVVTMSSHGSADR